MKILNHLEIYISLSEIEQAVKSFNEDMISEARRRINNEIDEAFGKANPNVELIISHRTFSSYSGPLLFIDVNGSFDGEIKPFLINYWRTILPIKIIEKIEDAKSGRIVVTQDDGEKSKEIGFVDFEILS